MFFIFMIALHGNYFINGLICTPHTHANSFVIGTAVINTHY